MNGDLKRWARSWRSTETIVRPALATPELRRNRLRHQLELPRLIT